MIIPTVRLAAVAVLMAAAVSAPSPPPPIRSRISIEAIVPNENRLAAGKVSNGVLTIALEAREAAWHLEGPRGPGVPVFSFAEVGKPAQVPAPLIRANAGTEIRATVHNTTPKRLVMAGLQDHASALLDSVAIEAGATREFRFRVDIPGTYLYFGRTEATLYGHGHDSQLVGAFVVDPGGARPTPGERIFVITSYLDTVRGLGNKSERSTAILAQFGVKPNEHLSWAVNGLSWPHSERLAYTVGDTVRWRVINGGFATHPMHLHGFYYDVLSRGDLLRDTLYSRAELRKVVTEPSASRSTMTMRWVPTRSGNWLFHCHLIDHIDESLRFGQAPPPDASGHMNHAEQQMAGLVMGIKVAPGDSFVVRLTPDRAGTFIYHTHSDETAFLNGSANPAPIELRAGVTHRFRLINIAAADAKRVRLVGDSTVLWRAVAKDGAELPAQQATMRPAAQQLLPGETFDFEVLRTKSEMMSLEIITVGVARTLVTKVPVIVR